MVKYQTVKRSAGYAMRGLSLVWHEEQNFRIEIMAGLIALCLALILHFSFLELSVVILLIGVILAAECANSALERIIDIVKPRVSEYARVVKDVVASMMAILVLTSITIALFLYVPKIIIFSTIVIHAIFY